MKKLMISSVVSILTTSVCLGFVGLGIYFGWFKSPIAAPKDNAAFMAAVSSKIQDQTRGNAIVVLLQNWQTVDEYSYSTDKPVNSQTLFQMASVSKWVTTWGILNLVERGELNLDKPVSEYLTRWSLPQSQFNDQVTIRRLLQHSAGLGDGLGYMGFDTADEVQTIEASLTKALDAAPGTLGETKVTVAPGTDYKYSGGGFSVLQLVIEEVSGKSFNEFMSEAVFIPLGMHSATFKLNHEDPRLAQTFNEQGQLSNHYYYSALAAASLYASADDLVAYMRANSTSVLDSSASRLSTDSKRIMQDTFGSFMGKATYGTGAGVYGQDQEGNWIIGHDGGNRPAINTTVRINTYSGDGIIVLSSGSFSLASEIGSEWVYWQFGTLDIMAVITPVRQNLTPIGVGALVILIVSFVLTYRRLHSMT